VDFDQIESEILALVVNVEFSVAFIGLGVDMLLYAGRNISGANLLCAATRLRMLGVFLRKNDRCRRKK
jgi:hypothetical protein